jgi:hypothetical protein
MNSENKITTFVLEAAIDGITQSYLSERSRGHDPEVLADCISILTLHELLEEYADKGRNFVAFKTTQKGIAYLMKAKSMASVTAVVEA